MNDYRANLRPWAVTVGLLIVLGIAGLIVVGSSYLIWQWLKP